MISDSHKMIYIHIPKTGGYSIAMSLENLADNVFNNRFVTEEDIIRWNIDAMYLDQPTGHIPLRVLEKVVGIENIKSYFKFTFVRNPYDLMISHYFFIKEKFELNRSVQKTWFDEVVLAVREKKSFREFVLSLKDKKSFKNVLLKFITDSEGKIDMDFIGRFENIEADFDRLSKALPISLPLKHLNKTSHEHYSHYYDYETKRIIYELNKEDIQYFSYKFDVKGYKYYLNSLKVFLIKVRNIFSKPIMKMAGNIK